MYLRHGAGHPLGLAVHDVFDRTRKLEPGMVITIEPGVYVREADVRASPAYAKLSPADRTKIDAALKRYAGIGVRIEDDYAITPEGARLLSGAAPRTVAEIEAWMRQASLEVQGPKS
jgi:Xaa-Pro aminopeptidase